MVRNTQAEAMQRCMTAAQKDIYRGNSSPETSGCWMLSEMK